MKLSFSDKVDPLRLFVVDGKAVLRPYTQFHQDEEYSVDMDHDLGVVGRIFGIETA